VRLKVRGGAVVRLFVLRAPVQKVAVGQTTKHAHNPEALGTANATAVIVLGNVQAQMKAGFDIPAQAIIVEPSLGVKLGWFQAGHQGDQLIVAAGALAAESGRLFDQREAEGLSRGGPGLDGTAFVPTFISLHRPGPLVGGFLSGKNPPPGRVSSGQCFGARWVGCR
jgi:hypothetical protein